METSSPLTIASSVVFAVLGENIQIAEASDHFDLHFQDIVEEGPSFATRVIWSRHHGKICFGTAVHFDLSSIRNPEKLCKVLENSARPFLGDACRDVVSKLFFHTQDDKCVIPAYEAVIDYEPLDDDELRTVFKSTFVRSIHAMHILSPVFDSLSHGYRPTAWQRKRLIEKEDRRWKDNNVVI